MKPFAYVTDNNIAICKDTGITLLPYNYEAYTHMGVLLDITLVHDVFNIWIHWNTKLSRHFTKKFVLDATDTYGLSEYTYNKFSNIDDNYQLEFLRTWNKKQVSWDKRQNINITIPSNGIEYWHFNISGDIDTVSAKDFIACLYIVNRLLANEETKYHVDFVPENMSVSLAITPASTGKEVLRILNRGLRANWLETSDLTELPLNEAIIAQDIHWKKPQVTEDTMYFHTFDKNGAYLSSGNSVQVGTGIPKHVGSIPFDKKICGLWKVTFTGKSIYDGINLPLPFTNIFLRTNPTGYYWTPEIEIAIMLGYQVTVHDAWIWEKRHKVFNTWSNFYWHGYSILKERYRETQSIVYELAMIAWKLMYTSTIGSIGASRENMYHDNLVRVDWRNMIIADTRLKVLYRLNELVKQGYYPVMVNFDAISYLSNSDNPNSIPIMGVGLGRYKHQSMVLLKDVKETFNSTNVVNNVATLVNQLRS